MRYDGPRGGGEQFYSYEGLATLRVQDATYDWASATLPESWVGRMRIGQTARNYFNVNMHGEQIRTLGFVFKGEEKQYDVDLAWSADFTLEWSDGTTVRMYFDKDPNENDEGNYTWVINLEFTPMSAGNPVE